MKILVDADACPVKEIIVRAAKKYEKEVLMVCDVAHQLFYEEPFVTVKTVDKGADSADLVLANLAQKQDLCVTSDYGLATLFLTKGAVVLHPNGFFFERHISREMRRQKKSRGGHIKKRTPEQDAAFQKSLESFLSQYQE